MRRITKLGSVSLAVLIVAAGLLALDLFDGAQAAPDAPLLYRLESQHPVTRVAYAQSPVPDGPQVHAHVLSTPDGDTLEVRPRGKDQQPLWSEAAAEGDTPWRIVRLAIARDGTSVAAGTEDGRLLYLTSDQTLYDTFTEFSTGSPITGLAFDARGQFLSVATWHGDLYLFGRAHHVTHGSFIMHVPAPLPAGGVPGTEDRAIMDADQTVRKEILPLRNDTPLSARPWSHVALAGQAGGGDMDPSGLYLVAGTAYAEMYVYDLSRLHGPAGAAGMQPAVHRLSEGPCTQVDTPLGELEVPCSRQALERLLGKLPQTDIMEADMAVSALRILADQAAREVSLDAVLGSMGRELPLSGLDVTQGPGHQGAQLLVAALQDGTLEAFSIRASSSTPGSDQAPDVKRLWTRSSERPLEQLSLSALHHDRDGTHAVLATGDDQGAVAVYRIPVQAIGAPTPFLEANIGAGAPLKLLEISKGDPGEPDSATAGRYLFTATQGARISLHQLRDLAGAQTPRLLWQGDSVLSGPVNHAVLLDTGGVLLAGHGIAVYASLVSARIDAPSSVDRHAAWQAQAMVEAPDTQVAELRWRVEPVETNHQVEPITATGAELSHTFEREGTYRVSLTVADDRGVETVVLKSLQVGGKNPILKMKGPGSVAVGQDATFDFGGTNDPNLPAGAGPGITRITVRPYGDARTFEADVDSLTLTMQYEGPTGVYRALATAYDSEGRYTRAHVSVTVTAPEFVLKGTPATGPNDLERIVVASGTGTSVAFGGDGENLGRFALRDGEAELLHQEGDARNGISGGHFTSGAITPDGSLFVGGRYTGEAMRLATSNPSQQTTLQVFDEKAIDWAFVSDDGERALFVSRDGTFQAAHGNLSTLTRVHESGREIVEVVADERLINVVARTTDGEVLVVDGHRPDFGVRDSGFPAAEVSTMAMTPNLDPMGRVWVFFGGPDGTVETWRIVAFDIAVQGRHVYDDELPVHSFAVGRLDQNSRYTLTVATSHDRINCPTSDGRPCGRLFFTDSTAPKQNGVPTPERTTFLEKRPVFSLMDPSGTRFLVGTEGTDPRVFAYDSLWDEGPVAELSGFGDRLIAGGMATDRSGHIILQNDRHAWTFAPPMAAMRLGPHDADGAPQWGDRIHVGVNVTLDSGVSEPGHGSIIAAGWELGDEQLEGLSPAHKWGSNGYKTVRLTVTSRITSPVEALLTDRVERVVSVYPHPPVARLSADPFNASAGAVTILSGEHVQFDASGSYHPTGQDIVDYRFQSGTGAAKNSRTPYASFSYPQPGTYYAKVTVADQHSSTDTSKNIRVEVANRPPTASFSYDQPERNEPAGRVSAHVPVHFDASPSNDPDGHVVAWQWEFPDGTTSGSKTPTHTFSTTGDQVVKLRVRDDHGLWSPWLEPVFQVEKGIRLKTVQDPADGSFTGTTNPVTIDAFVHDLRNWPAQGNPVKDATVQIKVYYDGLDGQASTPYETVEYTTPSDGWVEHEIGYSGTMSYNAGRHRVEVIAHIEGVYGDTLWTGKSVTTFRVEP